MALHPAVRASTHSYTLVADDGTIRTAVARWLADRTAAEGLRPLLAVGAGGDGRSRMFLEMPWNFTDDIGLGTPMASRR